MKFRRKTWTSEFGLRLLLIVPIAFLVPTFILPLGNVIYRGLGDGTLDFYYFAEIFTNSTYLTVLLQTFEVAALSTAICVLIGFPVAYHIANAKPVVAGLGLAFVLIPFWTSVVTRTYAWVTLLSRKGLINSVLIDAGFIETPFRLMYNMFGVQVGMVQFLLPMMILPLVGTMKRLDNTKLLAAAVLGANPFRVFVHVYLPLCLPGVLAGSVLVFVTALGFYITPAQLGSDRDMMIAVLIAQHVTQTLNWNLASALATVLLLMVLLSLLAVVGLARLRRITLELS
jgi:ABC-type spermidine/putrescine transport system permease subunit I